MKEFTKDNLDELRVNLSAQAMCAIIGNEQLRASCRCDDTYNEVAAEAVNYADALIARLKAPEQEPEQQPTSETVETPVGGEYEQDGKKYIVKETYDELCEGCSFSLFTDNCECEQNCSAKSRNDKKNVVFIKKTT